MSFETSRSFVGTRVLPADRSDFYRDNVKRLMDLAIVAIALVPTVIVVGLLALIIMVDGGKPFYWQKRVGRAGRVYYMLKLRSMVKDADKALAAHLARNPQARAEWDEMQKLRDDPRITRIGRFIRKSSLDELPQLWNVLKGDMSIVGPRPMMVEQVALYPSTAYFDLAPGITGYWQISDRNECSFAERAWYDNLYFREVGLVTDVTVILRTVKVVLRGTGV